MAGEGGEGLADYFARLAEQDERSGSGESDEEGAGEAGCGSRRRREMPPLTPGGRVARSMDERRTWEPLAQV